MASEPMNDSMTLSDGRTLGFQRLGDPSGKASFFFHGTPGSRLGVSATDPIARIPGLRLIVPDRPGYGISDPKPDRVLLDWARDVAELADHLGIQTFAVGGVSGGGPHALACAYALKDRVTVAFALSCPSPIGIRGAMDGMSLGNRLGLLLHRFAPSLARRMMRSNALTFEKDPEGFVDAMAKQMAPSDRESLASVSHRDALIRDFREAYRQGCEGHAVDGALAMASRDWGFDLREITVPVYLWHGEEDRLLSMQMARHLATTIPTCTARVVPGTGHLLEFHPPVMEELGTVLSGRLYEHAADGAAAPLMLER